MAKKLSSNTVSSEVQAIVSKADALFAQREHFEQNDYARSNASLYALLAEVKNMYEHASSDPKLLAEIVREMKAKLQTENVKVQTNTLALTLFVRYVFRTDRQRSMNYSRTIQAAIQQNIHSENLAEFISDNGGVEACKKAFTKSQKVIEKEALLAQTIPLVDEALAAAMANPIGHFKVEPNLVERVYDEDFVFVLGKADKQGNVHALTTIPAYSASVTKWAKQQLALFNIDQQAIAEKNAKADRKNQAIKKNTMLIVDAHLKLTR